jgi:hypothetical protein
MTIGLFLLGALGALLTVYLAKQEVVPEFRPLSDTSDKEKEALELRDHIRTNKKDADDIQAKLREETLAPGLEQRLTTVLTTSLSEINAETTRLETLEREITRGQVVSRGLGFVIYIVLGGVFGSLLAGRVKVEGLSGDLPSSFASILIGATWTTYLSTIGFRTGQKKADERIEAAMRDSAESINAVKKEITETVGRAVAKAETTDKVQEPVLAEAAARRVGEKIDLAALKLQNSLNLTRQMVQKDLR